MTRIVISNPDGDGQIALSNVRVESDQPVELLIEDDVAGWIVGCEFVLVYPVRPGARVVAEVTEEGKWVWR